MVAIGKVLSTDERTTVTSLLVSRDSIFCDGEQLSEPGLIETMAQTAAARAGLQAMALPTASAPPIGYIGAISNLHIAFRPAVGDEVITTVTIDYEVLNVSLVTARVTVQDRIAAECAMKIFLVGAP